MLRKRLGELRPVLANAIVGDFTTNLKIPEHEDEFTELFVGVQTMQEVIREQLEELKELNQNLESKVADRTHALEEAQALTHLGNWEFDIASGNICWSDELYRIFGLKPEGRAVTFEEFTSLIHPDDRERVSKTIGHSMETCEPYEFIHRIIRPDGKIRTVHGLGKVEKGPDGKPWRMFGTSQDISDRITTEQALHKSDERFQAVTNATHDLVYDLDLSSGTMWFNEVLQNEYGYHKRDIVPTLEWWLSLMHPNEIMGLEEQFEALLKSKRQTWSVEYRVRKADGSYALVRNRAFLIRDSRGKPERMVGTCLDITEAKQLERAKDEFISLVSHQLRTPLTIIRLYGNMLTDGIAGPLGDLQMDYVSKITGASIRLIKLVGDILNISRMELNRIKIDTTPCDSGRLIRDCIDELTPIAERKTAKIIFTPDKDIKPVKLDSTIFSEILHNLVGNALNYSRSQGGSVHVRFQKQKRGYLLSVTDDGVGIPDDSQPHIYERFYRARNAGAVDSEGSGLGLYMVKLFTEAGGGKTWFKSIEGKGTTFYVLFPPEGMRSKAGAVRASRAH
jgi:PAS domain S-box-containing protein